MTSKAIFNVWTFGVTKLGVGFDIDFLDYILGGELNNDINTEIVD